MTGGGFFGRARSRFRHQLLDRLEGMAAKAPYPPLPGIGSASGSRPIGIAIVGCGFVADFYAACLPAWPMLMLRAVHDRDDARAAAFAGRNPGVTVASLDVLLADPNIAIIVNLTNPASHAAITRAALMAGKHVYSEKPMALDIAEAGELVALARARSLHLACAPCTVLSETAQAMRFAIARGDIGTVRLVYAELDDGPVHQMRPQEWASPQGTPWPWVDELATGCTLQHACYHLGWMTLMFGPIEAVSGISRTLDPDKGLGPIAPGPDFSVACVTFRSGVTARLTCSTIAPHDQLFRVIGDRGELFTDACWHGKAPVYLRRHSDTTMRAEGFPVIRRHALLRALFGLHGSLSDLSPRATWRERIARHQIDYASGIADLARALAEGGEPVMSGERALDVARAVIAIDGAGS